jgi:hypothetical protein
MNARVSLIFPLPQKVCLGCHVPREGVEFQLTRSGSRALICNVCKAALTRQGIVKAAGKKVADELEVLRAELARLRERVTVLEGRATAP